MTNSLSEAIRRAWQEHTFSSAGDCDCGWEPDGAENAAEANDAIEAHLQSALVAAVTAWISSMREALVAAKLAGTTKVEPYDEWGYQFRTNEQAADLALAALTQQELSE